MGPFDAMAIGMVLLAAFGAFVLWMDHRERMEVLRKRDDQGGGGE